MLASRSPDLPISLQKNLEPRKWLERMRHDQGSGRPYLLLGCPAGQPDALTFSQIFQLPARQAWVLARLSRGPKRSIRGYVSIGPERKRSQNPGSAGAFNS